MSCKAPAPDPTRAIAYLRCSTDRQDLSPEVQRDAISVWAEREGVEVVAWHEDLGVSGGAELEQRPGLTAAVADLGPQGAGLLVVAKRDRLARDVLTAALVERLCERAGARVASADGTGNGDTPEAALLRSMIDAFAAYERALIRSRTRAALAVKKAKGERVGGIPYGFRLGGNGKLVEDARERDAVALARRLRAEGRSLRAVAAGLASSGFQPRSGKRWHVAVLARIVS
jgi:DNA invertase Pin-like site-specific DNA recombinase